MSNPAVPLSILFAGYIAWRAGIYFVSAWRNWKTLAGGASTAMSDETTNQETPQAAASGELLTIVRGLPEQERAKIWCSLNRFEWPEQLPRPNDWLPQSDLRKMRHPTFKALWDELNASTSLKACLREWNRDRMDDDEFEAFWRSRARRLMVNSD